MPDIVHEVDPRTYTSEGGAIAAALIVVRGTAHTQVKLPTGQGVISMGVTLNATTAAAQEQIIEFTPGAKVRVKVAGTVTAGAECTPAGTSGKGEAAASGDYVLGVFLDDGVADDLVSMVITHGGWKA